MAHYNAINESRFKFSHNYSYLPVHGLEGILKKQNVQMKFRNLNGKQVTFHKAYNYLYRPTQMEDMPLYKYYSDTKFIKMSQARKLGIEHFKYTEKHLFRQYEAVMFRKTPAVPSFPWNWLGSTKSFLTSLLHPTDKDATDHHKKEEYAFRFMLLFVPFRSVEDLKSDDGLYQNAFQRAHDDGRITLQTHHSKVPDRIP